MRWFAKICPPIIITVMLMVTGLWSKTLRSPDFDVLHYKIQLNLDEKQKSVDGKTAITVLPVRKNIHSLILNAVDMQIKAISTTPPRDLSYLYDSTRLQIQFEYPPDPRDTLHLNIDYLTHPDYGIFFFDFDSSTSPKIPQIYSDSEPEDARYWFPCIDHPSDKATSELIVTTNALYQVISNGKLIDVRDHPENNTRTFHWRQSKPHPTYLISFVAGPYASNRSRYQELPLCYYFYPAYKTEAAKLMKNTGKMLDLYRDLFGMPFPWSKYAQVFVTDFKALGMENTGLTFLSDKVLEEIKNQKYDNFDELVCHELAHQWFGNLVTCQDWADIWMNEGFATYAEYLYFEQSEGHESAQYHLLLDLKDYVKAAKKNPDRPIVYPDYIDPWEMFNSFTYNKAAWGLHMLRFVVGDALFFQSLREYLKKYAFSNASTLDFQQVVEQVSGQNLDWFFDQWYFRSGHPQFQVESQWKSGSNQLTLVVRQTQTHHTQYQWDLFKTPVLVEIVTEDTVMVNKLWISKEEEKFKFTVSAPPKMVRFDKGGWILKELDFPKTTPDLVWQLHHDDDITGRVKALEQLETLEPDSMMIAAYIQALTSDSFWAIRRKAASLLKEQESPQALIALKNGLKDSHLQVRKACLKALPTSWLSQIDAFPILKNIISTDSANQVIEQALKVLPLTNDSAAFPVLVKFLEDEIHPDLFEAALTGLSKSRDARAISVGLKYADQGHPSRIRLLGLRILSENSQTQLQEVEPFLIRLLSDESRTIVSRSISMLGEFKSKNALPYLEAFKENSYDDDLKFKAQAAIDQIKY